ncbi:type I asparaginase [Candidatus Sororendozoicomonas aggregata]|uniref:type I asparaginase n=1 Tax=Candidatus Sororendozoicomonas aggregata TaxID=3073239 RepID=UPI002ED5988F
MSKKIYVAYTGGTIGMVLTDKGYVPTNNLLELLLKKLPEATLAQLPAFDLFEYPLLIDSSNIQPAHWQVIAADISNRYEQYDGFVILHGTDTMAYTSSMLSFMLQGLGKPVIVTGSQIPLCEPDTDALDNVMGALTVAEQETIKEVCLYFAGRILRGNRSRKIHTSAPAAFDSPNAPWLGTLDTALAVNEELLWSSKPATSFNLACDIAPHAAPVSLFPGISAKYLSALLDQPFSAFILQTYGAGNGPDQDQSLLKTLSKATAAGKVIVNVSQCYQGSVSQGVYGTGTALADAGLVSACDTTPEALFCKLHYLLSQGFQSEQVKAAVNTSLCGEVTVQ